MTRTKADGTVKGESTSYLHQDHLGSTSVITGRDTAGKVVVLERQYYDAFGLPLKDSTDARTAATKSSDITKQGFTGHETLAAFGLIQMNARLYDPALGRFISADTFIQSPLNLQSYNRYSYVLNNPLSYTDPTGHFFKKLGRALKKAGQWISDNRTMIAMVALTVAFGFAGSAIANAYISNTLVAAAVGGAIGGGLSGAATAIVAGGSGQDILMATVKGAAIGAVSGAAFSKIGTLKEANKLGKIGGVLAHGAAGGVTNMLRGGNAGEAFKSGFISGVVTAGAHESETIMKLGAGSAAGEVALSAAIGGTASHLSGGDFANGAMTATFQTLYNRQAHGGRNSCAERLRNKRHQELLKGAQDGHITLSEANAWRAEGTGQSLSADLSKIDLSQVSASEFPNGIGSTETIDTFLRSEDGWVYGKIDLTLVSANEVVSAKPDTYDFFAGRPNNSIENTGANLANMVGGVMRIHLVSQEGRRMTLILTSTEEEG